MRLALLAGTLAAAILASGAAQAETKAQMDANKTLILEFYRQVFEAQDVGPAKNFLAPGMIEHNPNLPQGLDGFMKGFGPRWKPRPAEAKLRSPPVVALTDGPFVQLVFQRPKPEPTDPSKTYDSYWFDLFKIEGGKVVEHWDGALKPVKTP